MVMSANMRTAGSGPEVEIMLVNQPQDDQPQREELTLIQGHGRVIQIRMSHLLMLREI